MSQFEVVRGRDTSNRGVSDVEVGVTENARHVLPCTSDGAPVTAANPLSVVATGEENVFIAAGSTAVPLGAVGATGDRLARLVFPNGVAAGTSLTDGADTYAIATSTVPISIEWGGQANSGWALTTGVGTVCAAVGDFT